MISSWEAVLNNEGYSQTTVGSAYSNSVTLTDVSPGGSNSGQAFQMLGSAMYTGMQVRFRAQGIVTTTGSPQLTLGVYYGGVAGTALAASTFTASANMSNNARLLEALMRVDSTGPSGTTRTQGHIVGMTSTVNPLPATSSTGGQATIATGSNNIITLGAQWGTANASNSLTVYQWVIEQLN